MALSTRDVENVLRTIFRRCVECPPEQPTCPVCPTGYVCSQIASSCTLCAKTQCIPSLDFNNDSGQNKSSKTNVGAIAGGVVAGVTVIVALTWIIWRYCLKGRRQQLEETDWEEEEITPEKSTSEFTMRRDARASTHTVASLASTVLTRASNIIQIAYIPGVTNRSDPHSPGLLVPPVPPIPIATTSSTASTPYSTEDQHFFVPGDLRDSTYSGYTDYSDVRTSIAPSLARSSVATTIYRNNAIVSPIPAQTVVRGKAAVVSVKSSQSNSPMTSPDIDTPPVPPIDPAKIFQGPIKIQMPASSDANLSPQSSLRSTATMGKPTALTITKKGKAMPVRTPSSETTATASTEKPASPDISPPDTALSTPRPETAASFLTSDSESDSEAEPDHARSRRSLLRQSVASSSRRDSQLTTSTESPSIASPSPFADMSSSIHSPGEGMRSPHHHRNSGLSTVMEGTDDERSRRGSKASMKANGAGPTIDAGPFGDENALTRTP